MQVIMTKFHGACNHEEVFCVWRKDGMHVECCTCFHDFGLEDMYKKIEEGYLKDCQLFGLEP